MGRGLGGVAVKLAPDGERGLAADSGMGGRGTPPEYGRPSLRPSPGEPTGVSGLLGSRV